VFLSLLNVTEYIKLQKNCKGKENQKGPLKHKVISLLPFFAEILFIQ
jgi:hypothetical protein